MSSYRCPLIVVGVGAGFILVGSIPVAITFAVNSQSSAKIIGMGFVGFGILLLVPGLFWCVVVRALHGFKRWRRRSIRGRQLDGTGSRDGLGEGGAERSSASSGDVGPTGGAGSTADGKSAADRSSTGLFHTDVNEDDDGCGDACQNDDVRAIRRTSSKSDESRRQRRNRSWPSSYSEPPALIISDGLVCQATTTQPLPGSTAEDGSSPVTEKPNGDAPRIYQHQQPLQPVSPPIVEPSVGQNDVFIDVIVKCDDQRRPIDVEVAAAMDDELPPPPLSPLMVLASPPRPATGSPALSKSTASAAGVDDLDPTEVDDVQRTNVDDSDDVRMECTVASSSCVLSERTEPEIR